MNPNLLFFLRSSAKVLAIGILLFLVVYLIDAYTIIDIEKIAAYLMYGFFAVVMVFMMALIIGITFKSIWISVMRRTGNIAFCCLDSTNEGIHIIGSHYFSGGDSGDGYYSYHHYFIRLSDGKLFMSKKIKDEKQITNSLQDLSAQTKLPLKLNSTVRVEVGSNVDGDDVATRRVLQTPDGDLTIQGFESWLDEGFRISLSKESKIKWRRVI
jgi:hypothetical protein